VIGDDLVMTKTSLSDRHQRVEFGVDVGETVLKTSIQQRMANNGV
jgi:hypothetical protein